MSLGWFLVLTIGLIGPELRSAVKIDVTQLLSRIDPFADEITADNAALVSELNETPAKESQITTIITHMKNLQNASTAIAQQLETFLNALENVDDNEFSHDLIISISNQIWNNIEAEIKLLFEELYAVGNLTIIPSLEQLLENKDIKSKNTAKLFQVFEEIATQFLNIQRISATLHDNLSVLQVALNSQSSGSFLMEYVLYGAMPAFEQCSVSFGLVNYCVTELINGYNLLRIAKAPKSSGIENIFETANTCLLSGFNQTQQAVAQFENFMNHLT